MALRISGGGFGALPVAPTTTTYRDMPRYDLSGANFADALIGYLASDSVSKTLCRWYSAGDAAARVNAAIRWALAQWASANGGSWDGSSRIYVPATERWKILESAKGYLVNTLRAERGSSGAIVIIDGTARLEPSDCPDGVAAGGGTV